MKKILLFACAVLTVSALPASATHPGEGPHPTFRTENAYFHCSGGVPVQNVGATGAIPWNTTAPTASVQSGAGCGATDANLLVGSGTAQENIYDAVFSGSFTGNLKAMTVKLHSLVMSQARTGATLVVKVRLAIDGEQLFTTSAAAKSVTVTPVKQNNGATEYVEFSITNLGFANYITNPQGDLVDVQTGGLAKEEGDGESEHSIVLSVDTFSTPTQGLWVLDTTEVPAGITFNPATLAAAKITSPLPVGSGE